MFQSTAGTVPRLFNFRSNKTQAPDQFKINPRLQRTQAGEPSVRQGFTLGTFINSFPVEADDVIRLKNRAVPLNNKFRQLDRVLRRDVIGGLDVPDPPALTKPNEGGSPKNEAGKELQKRG